MVAGLVEDWRDDGVLFVTLDRPARRNALSDPLIATLAERLAAAAGDPGLRVVVLRATGTVFCAGYDLRQNERHDPDRLDRSTWTMLSALREMPVPTIALVDGPALGVGCALALACDRVIATESAIFALPETRHGIVPALVLPFVRDAVGERLCRLMAVQSLRVGAIEAQTAGAVAEVIADAAALADRGEEVVRHLLSLAPGAVRATEALLTRTSGRPFDDSLFAELALASQRGRTSTEARDGLLAFRKAAAGPD